jgi:signal transduction histidine kinase
VRPALFDGRVPRWLLPAVWSLFACYAGAIALTGFIFDRSTQHLVRGQIDEELRVAVTMATAAFPSDLRGKAAAGVSLEQSEDRMLARRADKLCIDSGIAYLYALYIDDAGVVRHLWTNDPDKELPDDSAETWFGHPYEDCAQAVRDAIASGCGLHYETYTDHYGDFRGCYLGLRDHDGHNYVIGADRNLAEVESTLSAMRRKVALGASGSVLAGLLLGIGLHVLIRRLQSALRDLSLLAEVAHATGHAVLLADPDGRVRWANSACPHHLGIATERVVGRSLVELLGSGGSRSGLVEAVRQAQGGMGGSCEMAGPGHPGADWLLVDLRPVANPSGAAWVVCMLRDLSQHRSIQQTLERAREQAERTAAAKTAFLANMSHEIRTPLNGILGMTGLLLERNMAKADHELVQVAHSSGEVLLRLLGDILDLTKIEAQAMHIESKPCDLGNVATEVVQLFRTTAQSKGLSLDVIGEPLWVLVDGVRMRQVLSNLVSNAIKFTDSGKVTVSLSATAQGELRRVHLVVADTGIGIPEERQAELFQPFVQVDDSMTRRAGGTGLGLAISRRLVELMGGTLGLESKAGTGSRFIVDITLPPARIPTGAQPALRAAPRNGRVLVAAGNRTNRTVASLLLRGHGVQDVELADDAQSAIAAAMAGPCALVLLDLDLPGGAPAVAAALRVVDGASRSTPIIALHGDGHMLPAGFDGSLARPVSADALRPMLDRWCPPL